MTKRTIAVVGAGSVGSALATGLAAAGHDVVVGVRDPLDDKHDELQAAVSLALPTEAAERSELVVLAVPAASLPEVVQSLDLRSGQIVIDATNSVGSPLPAGFSTLGRFVASLVPPGVAVVKAFNTIGAEYLSNGKVGDVSAFLPIAGDEAGLPMAEEVAADLGFDVVALGGQEAMELVENHARLWIHLALRCGWGRNFGFSAIRE